jgi:hypothetical protein
MSEVELTNAHVATPDILPDDPAPAKAEMTPQAALELVRAGKPIENAKIRRLKFRGDFALPVRFRNCTLTQPEFDAANFAEEVSFVGCTLDKVISTKATTFAKGLDVGGCVVNRGQLLRWTVNGKFAAAHAEFRGKVQINGCHFLDRVSFWEAKFVAWAEFKDCRFHAEADFRSVICGHGFVLTNCTFDGDFLFRGGCVDKKFSADGCRFERALDLSKAKLHDFVYLEDIEQGKLQTFAFLNAVAERIRVQPTQLEGRLASEIAGKYDEAMQEYGLLKKCFQTLHRFDHEDWAFYRFKVCQRMAKPKSLARPWALGRVFADWLFLDVGCGYGTNPARAVRMALVIILGFAALYGYGIEQFYAEKLPFPDADKTAPENRLMVGLITSVSVFTSGMGGIREVAKGWMNVPVMVESIMGTLLFGLFIVAFSRKVIR